MVTIVTGYGSEFVEGKTLRCSALPQTRTCGRMRT
jgi:hypothetical protein